MTSSHGDWDPHCTLHCHHDPYHTIIMGCKFIVGGEWGRRESPELASCRLVSWEKRFFRSRLKSPGAGGVNPEREPSPWITNHERRWWQELNSNLVPSIKIKIGTIIIIIRYFPKTNGNSGTEAADESWILLGNENENPRFVCRK
jgi:hypothetical protein